MVFTPNLGVVRFETNTSEQHVVHELWSSDAPNSTEGAPFTHHRSPLATLIPPQAPQLQVVVDD
jgi:hypothetical protein